jgi:hypothetical protein
MRSPEEEIGALVRETFVGTSGEFRPCAFFDVRLDCIRVIARDCSVLETRINPYLTVLEDNYYQEAGRKQYVGFTVKGARYFCNKYGLSMSAPIEIGALLDAILKAFPDLAVEFFVNGIARPLVQEGKIETVDVSGASGRPAFESA